MNGWIAACIFMWSRAAICSALTKAGGSAAVSPPRAFQSRKAWSSTAYSRIVPSGSRFFRV